MDSKNFRIGMGYNNPSTRYLRLNVENGCKRAKYIIYWSDVPSVPVQGDYSGFPVPGRAGEKGKWTNMPEVPFSKNQTRWTSKHGQKDQQSIMMMG